ncbi:MAG: zinc ribbon domain-containing protein [Actinobacteria bacterium]|nr:zinc ribbon domain-containing protein [Actinomycetota bacterium]
MATKPDEETCPRCGTELVMKGTWLHCPNCGYQMAPPDETATFLAVRPDKEKGQEG